MRSVLGENTVVVADLVTDLRDRSLDAPEGLLFMIDDGLPRRRSGPLDPRTSPSSRGIAETESDGCIAG